MLGDCEWLYVTDVRAQLYVGCRILLDEFGKGTVAQARHKSKTAQSYLVQYEKHKCRWCCAVHCMNMHHKVDRRYSCNELQNLAQNQMLQISMHDDIAGQYKRADGPDIPIGRRVLDTSRGQGVLIRFRNSTAEVLFLSGEVHRYSLNKRMKYLLVSERKMKINNARQLFSESRFHKRRRLLKLVSCKSFRSRQSFGDRLMNVDVLDVDIGEYWMARYVVGSDL